VSYLPPFAFVKQKYRITANADRDRATLMYRDLLDIVKLLLRGITVDEPWYLAQYPDVSEAIQAGMFKSAKHHFVENGYFEGRRPALDWQRLKRLRLGRAARPIRGESAKRPFAH